MSRKNPNRSSAIMRSASRAIYQRGGAWWVKYYQHGRPIRESTHSTAQRDAEKLLLRRSAAIEEGRTIQPTINRAKIDELLQMVVTDYRVNDKRSLANIDARIKNQQSLRTPQIMER